MSNLATAATASAQPPAVSPRLFITTKDAQPLVLGRRTFFSIPGELRNQVYDLTLGAQAQRTPLNPFHLNLPDPYVALLQTCSQLYSEARSYLVEKKTAYVPVTAGMDYSYGPPEDAYGLSRETKDTIAAALTDFMSVHLHLHIDLIPGQERYRASELLGSLHDAIARFQPCSWELYLKHNMGNRQAVVHLDHLLSLWPKMYAGQNCVPVGALKALVDLLARDRMTDWEIRYYVPTGQVNGSIVYGNSHDLVQEGVRDGELAQLRYYAKLSGHDSIAIVAETYGEDTTWGYGDKTGAITRHRTPATEFWPNAHFDPSRYAISRREHFVKAYPALMPIEYFDEEALAAKRINREKREGWISNFDRRWRGKRASDDQEDKETRTARSRRHTGRTFRWTREGGQVEIFPSRDVDEGEELMY